MEKLKNVIDMPFKDRVCTDCPCYDKWCDGCLEKDDCSYTLLSYFYHISCKNDDKALEKHEQKDKDEQTKTVHELTITVDRETLEGWDDPLGFMDGGYRAVWGEFENGITVKVEPSMTLEGDDFTKVYLYKDGKEVASTYPYFLFDPICIEYNNEEYHIQLEEGM